MVSAPICEKETLMRLHPLSIALAAIAALALAVPAGAQNRATPVKIVFPFPGGGSGDALTRLLAERFSESLQRPVIVEPRPGAAGRLGIQFVKASEPD